MRNFEDERAKEVATQSSTLKDTINFTFELGAGGVGASRGA
jgi:hypothetical protein